MATSLPGTSEWLKCLGVLEVFLFYNSLYFGYPEVILAWLAFKVASKWEVWTNIVRVPESPILDGDYNQLRAQHAWGSRVLATFLLGNLGNLCCALIGFIVFRLSSWFALYIVEKNSHGILVVPNSHLPALPVPNDLMLDIFFRVLGGLSMLVILLYGGARFLNSTGSVGMRSRQMSARTPKIHWLIFVMLIAAIAAIAAAWYFYARQFHGLSSDQARWGQAGDYFGGFLGAGLAFLALLALLWSVHIQKKELSETTRILAGQAEEMERQNAKDTFFRMLQLHNENTRALYLHITDRRAEAHGRNVIGVITDSILSVRGAGIPMPELLQRAQETFTGHYVRYANSLGHYLRTLYTVFRFVHDAEALTTKDKKELAVLARAQISDDELELLFFNGLTDQGKNFKPLYEEFALFDNLREKQLRDWSDLLSFYEDRAYGPELAKRASALRAEERARAEQKEGNGKVIPK